MKILVVSQFFDPENFRINDLVEELDLRGNEITVLTGLPNYPGGTFYKGYSYFSSGKSFKGNIKIVRVPVIPRFSSSKIQLAINYVSFVISACLMGGLYCRQRYDVIFTYAPSPVTVAIPAIFLNFFKKIPHIIWVQDLWPEVFMAVEAPKTKIFYETVRQMMRFIYKRSDIILIQSKDFKDSILKLGAVEEKIRYFPNWAEIFFKPIKKDITLNQGFEIPAQDTFTIMFAGNIGAAQCFDVILKSAVRLRDENISWVILGDGRRRVWLEEQIKLNSLEHVMFTLGNKPVQEMPFYYSLADVMLVSLEPHPVFSAWVPGKIQSYLACGKPIIGLLSGAGARVIEEGDCGYAVQSGDPEELSKKIKELSCLSEEDLLTMGSMALEYNDKTFNRDKLISELESIFKETKLYNR